ncbi:sigma-54-dependent Fis family transcriptional regulator [Sphingomonadaceae bacterium LXI357]|uniref:Sigma-54-dependent Fis family transcriptional regulator n=2 Tax=Stakelama marina TaxID=2826939 RepID=A0A8T4I9L3_9SPHN|nr:sigma-54-dependent Fis family transcriptional regulator [Stakelama marina]
MVDDDPAVGRAMKIAFEIAGHRLDLATGPEEAYSRLAERRYDAILLDLNFGPNKTDGEEGLRCLRRIMADDPDACVLVITAHSGIRIAVTAMQLGASDFAIKPWRNANLIAKVGAAIERKAGSASAVVAAPMVAGRPVGLLGESQAMEHLRDLVRRVGSTVADVIITGRPGSGRSLTASAILAAARDSTGQPEIRIDLRDRSAWGRLDQPASALVLRHPDQLDPIAQEQLLERLPSTSRCIAIAGSIDPIGPALRRRIATIEIAVPTLDARGDDSVLLARHFARLASERFGKPVVRLSEAAEALVRTTHWPDEVRGLALAVERAVLLAEDQIIKASALAPSPVADPGESSGGDDGFDLGDAERTIIEAALRAHHHNVTQAAAALGLSRGALYRRIARYGL